LSVSHEVSALETNGDERPASQPNRLRLPRTQFTFSLRPGKEDGDGGGGWLPRIGEPEVEGT